MKSLKFITATAAAIAALAAATPARAQTTALVYDGYVYDGPAVRGTLTLTLKLAAAKGGTTNWTFTGKAQLQNAAVSFVHKAVNLPPEGAVEISMKTGEKINLEYESLQISGTLSGGKAGGPLEFSGYQNVFADKKNKGAQDVMGQLRGLYNVALLESMDEYHGWFSMNAGSYGAVKIAGKMSDGTAVSGAAKMVWAPVGGVVAFHRPLYKKRGSVGGVLVLNPENWRISSGMPVRWENTDPAKAFSKTLYAAGGWFGTGKNVTAIPPGFMFHSYASRDAEGLPAPAANITGDWVYDAFPWEIEVKNKNGKLYLDKGFPPKKVGGEYTYTGDNPSMATLSYAPRTGLFRGSFKIYFDGNKACGSPIHKQTSVPYTGLMVPYLGEGVGFGMAPINREKISIPIGIW